MFGLRALALVVVAGAVTCGGQSSRDAPTEGSPEPAPEDESGGAPSGAGGEAGASAGDGCPGFAVALDESRCEACRHPSARCESEENQVVAICDSVHSCVGRHCAFLYCEGASCETDTCSCIALCLPEEENACRSAWERWMRCNRAECAASCASP